MNSAGENIFQDSSLLIWQALGYPKFDNYMTFVDDSLMFVYKTLFAKDKNKLFGISLLPRISLPSNTTKFSLTFFFEDVKPFLLAIMSILGKYDIETIIF